MQNKSSEEQKKSQLKKTIKQDPKKRCLLSNVHQGQEIRKEEREEQEETEAGRELNVNRGRKKVDDG